MANFRMDLDSLVHQRNHASRMAPLQVKATTSEHAQERKAEHPRDSASHMGKVERVAGEATGALVRRTPAR
jgi:hypothetical protein